MGTSKVTEVTEKKLIMAQTPTEDELKEFNRYYDAYLWIDVENDGRRCTCSACRETFFVAKFGRIDTPEDREIRAAKHKDAVQCPKCGRTCEVRFLKISRNPAKQGMGFAVIRAISHDEIHIDCYYTDKSYENSAQLPDWCMDSTYVLTPGRCELFVYRWYSYGWHSNHAKGWYSRGGKIIEPILDNLGGLYQTHKRYILLGTKQLGETFLRYNALNEWERYANRFKSEQYTSIIAAPESVRYLSLLAAYPGLETMLKAGYCGVVNAFLLGRRFYGKSCVDMTKGSPCEILHQSPATVKALRQINNYTVSALIAHYKHRKTAGWELSNIIALYQLGLYADSTVDCCENYKVTPRDLLGYLKKQYERRMREFEKWRATACASAGGGIKPTFGDCLIKYQDYQRMSRSLDLRHEDFPHDIYIAHDAVMETKRSEEARKTVITNKKPHRTETEKERWAETTKERMREARKFDGVYADRLSKRNAWRIRKLAFTDGEFMVVIPSSCTDLVNEGDKLHHCVGMYAETLASSRTNIVFLRKVSCPEAPMLTMEVNNKGEKVQCYGFNDDRAQLKYDEWKADDYNSWLATYDKRVRDFAIAYEQHLTKVFNKKENNEEEAVRVTAIA